MSTKLKLLGVEVASFGQSTVASVCVDGVDGVPVDEVVYHDPVNKIYRRLALDPTTGRLLGGALVGDSSGYEILTAITLGQAPQPDDLPAYVLPASVRPPAQGTLPDGALLCSCNAVSVGALRTAVADISDAAGACTLGELKACTAAGTSCGGCVPAVTQLLKDELHARGVTVSKALCEHFEHSRQELFDLVRFHRYRTWAEVLDNHGRGRLGCEVCRPTVASILASLSNGYVLDGDQAALQDTNDHHLANMQRDGTYSVVPRVPGGEITPDQLIALGQIAKDFDLYTKITGGQRIDLFGAQLHELPLIWQRVIDAGMESGHAYGKALRTVKSCVGSTWCRYGVQDSVAMAIRIEQRYRGLRSPHKLKMAVSGCTRECAEAQSKDVGVIATETGWNLYTCGNGGRSPRHADLLASDLTDAELITAIDRLLGFYIRTADRLQRTSTWFEQLDADPASRLDYLRSVIFDDVLGIAAELESDIQHHVDTYECEWKATLENPARLAHFVEFVNAPEEHSVPITISERGQRVPA
jgi:nitrite reductase (NADH) large subunit